MDYPPDEYDDDNLIVYPEAPQPFWTRRRVLLLIFAIAIIAALLAYSLPGLFIEPPAPAPTVPPPMI